MLAEAAIEAAAPALDAALGRALALVLPPPSLTVSEWADANRMLSGESSAEPGRWRTDKAPYQRGILDAFNDPSVDEVVVMSSAQVGKTEILNNVVGYFLDQDPCPVLVLQPTLDMAEAWSRDRLAPMIRDTACLAARVADPKSRDSGNTMLHKSFPGGNLDIVGANSPASLASRPKRILLCDEPDRYPVSAGAEGDPISLARKRTATYWNRKVGMFSTPTIKGASRIESAFEGSDQRRYFVPCTGCGCEQTMRWENVHWDKADDGRHQPDTARLECEQCGKHLGDADKARMLPRGHWQATAEFHGVAGFHLNELYSPWVPLSKIVREFLDAKRMPETHKTWINTALGETWEDDGEQLEEEFLLARRQPYAADPLPDGVAVLTAGVDVQDDRIELEVAGWGRGQERWSIDYRVLNGDPARPEVWLALDDILSGTWTAPSGLPVRIASVCIDTGGHRTQEVYKYCKPRYRSRVFAIKGMPGSGRPIVSRPTKNNRLNVPLFSIGVDTAKELIVARLRITEAGPGYYHFPARYPDEYFAQLTAEKRAVRYVKGHPVVQWIKTRARNEALDCAVYSLAALELLNANLDRLADRMDAAEKPEPAPEPVKPDGFDLVMPAPKPAPSRQSSRPIKRPLW
jgi:phage terminase large subunit GpA-like protein